MADIDDLGIIDFTARDARSIFDVVGPKCDCSNFTTYSGKITLNTDGAVLENFVPTGVAAWIVTRSQFASPGWMAALKRTRADRRCIDGR